MNNLSENITKLNKNNKLLVIRGPPATILPALAKEWRLTHLAFEVDNEKYAVARDKEVVQKFQELNLTVLQDVGHTLWDQERLLALCNGKPPLSYGPFVKLTEKAGDPPKPCAAPISLPPQGDTKISQLERAQHAVGEYQQEDVNARFKTSEDSIYDTMAGPNGTFSIPTFEELGLRAATTSHHGGEDRALKVLDEWCTQKQKEILSFEKPKTSPAAFQPPETTTLSAHLKFGCLSPRRFWWAIKGVHKGKGHSRPPVSLDGQLLWREFFRVRRCDLLYLLMYGLSDLHKSLPIMAQKTFSKFEATLCHASLIGNCKSKLELVVVIPKAKYNSKVNTTGKGICYPDHSGI